MLRATSETAAAMTVRSPEEKPRVAASCRLSWRAVTMSASARIGIRCPPPTAFAPLAPAIEEGQPLLEIEGGGHAAQGQAELDHGERHLGLDPHDHRHRPAQHDHL